MLLQPNMQVEKVECNENFITVYFNVDKLWDEIWSKNSPLIALDRLNSLGNKTAKNLSDEIVKCLAWI